MPKTKLASILLLLFLAILLAYAAEEDCGLTNLATYIPQKFFDYRIQFTSTSSVLSYGLISIEL